MHIQPHRWLGAVAAAVAAVAAMAAALPARPLVAATVSTAPAGGQLGDVAGVPGLGRRGSDSSPLRDLVLSERISADDVPGAYEVSGDQSTLCPRLLYCTSGTTTSGSSLTFLTLAWNTAVPTLTVKTCYAKATWFVPSDRLDDTAALVGAGVPSSFQGAALSRRHHVVFLPYGRLTCEFRAGAQRFWPKASLERATGHLGGGHRQYGGHMRHGGVATSITIAVSDRVPCTFADSVAAAVVAATAVAYPRTLRRAEPIWGHGCRGQRRR